MYNSSTISRRIALAFVTFGLIFASFVYTALTSSQTPQFGTPAAANTAWQWGDIEGITVTQQLQTAPLNTAWQWGDIEGITVTQQLQTAPLNTAWQWGDIEGITMTHQLQTAPLNTAWQWGNIESSKGML